MKKTKIAVLMGGKSPEHDVSIMSGGEVVRNLDPQKYEILPILVSKDGIFWQIGDRRTFLLDSPTTKVKNKKSKVKTLTIINPNSFTKDYKIDIVFIAMHGPYGEDGTVQGFLELINVPYTGSGVLASALGMDKIYSLKLFTRSGLKVPLSVTLDMKDNSAGVWKQLYVPFFVKPASHGSSLGISKVSSKKNLKKAISLARKYSNRVIVQEFIEGIEITCAILGNDKPRAFPLVEIVPKKEFFDYEAKYNEKLTDEIVPARVSNVLTQQAQEAALKAYRAIGCKDFGRVDMIIRGNDIYILEINTIPGLTPVSLFPKAAAAAGISYPKLLDKIIGLALNR